MPEKFIPLLQSLNLVSRSRARVYVDLMLDFITSSGAQQNLLISTFLSDFVLEMIVRVALKLCLNSRIDI